MRKENSKRETKFISEPGRHLKNDDYFAFVELDDYACYIMADGIDSQGLDSARLAIEAIMTQFLAAPAMSKRAMKRYLFHANDELLTASREGPLRASLTIILSDYRQYIYGVAGNTRLTHVRGTAVKAQSSDLSLSQTYVDEGRIPKDKLARHSERNNLSCFVGKHKFKPFISKKIPLADGDIITLYTRGVWEKLDQGELLDALNDAKTPEEFLDCAEELLLAKQDEHLDNYSIAAIFIEKVYEDAEKRKKKKKIIIITVVIVLVLLLALGIYLIVTNIIRTNRREELEEHYQVAIECIQDDNYPGAKDEFISALALAKALKDTLRQGELSRLSRMMDNIIQADADLAAKQYEKAVTRYNNILAASYLPEKPEQPYVSAQRDMAQDALEILDLLAQGDELRSDGDLDGALLKYKLARRKAAVQYMLDAKAESDQKITETEQERAELSATAAAKAEADAAKAQAEAAEAEKKELKASAISLEAEADKAYREGDLAAAADLYAMAQADYEAAGEAEKGAKLDDQMNKVEEKAAEAASDDLLLKAMQYEAAGDDASDEFDYIEAKVQYLLALEKYREAGLAQEASLVNNKIAGTDFALGILSSSPSPSPSATLPPQQIIIFPPPGYPTPSPSDASGS